MVFKLEGREKEIRIPDEDIKRIEKGLGVSTAEAIDIWLEDEGYLENEEQEQFTKQRQMALKRKRELSREKRIQQKKESLAYWRKLLRTMATTML